MRLVAAESEVPIRFSLKNKTHYRTDDLRRLVSAGLKAEGEPEKRYTVKVVYTRQDRGVSGLATIGGSWVKMRVPKGKYVREPVAADDFKTRGSPARMALARIMQGRRGHEDANWEIRDRAEDWKANRRERVWRGKKTTQVYSVLPDALRDDFARVFVHELLHNRGVTHSEMWRGHKRCGERCGIKADIPWASGIEIRAQEKAPPPQAGDLVAKREAHARKMLVRAERRAKVARTVLLRWKRKVTYYERRAAAGGGS